MNGLGPSEPSDGGACRFGLERNHYEVDDHQPPNQSDVLPAGTGGSRRDVCHIWSLSPLGGLFRQLCDAAGGGKVTWTGKLARRPVRSEPLNLRQKKSACTSDWIMK